METGGIDTHWTLTSNRLIQQNAKQMNDDDCIIACMCMSQLSLCCWPVSEYNQQQQQQQQQQQEVIIFVIIIV